MQCPKCKSENEAKGSGSGPRRISNDLLADTKRVLAAIHGVYKSVGKPGDFGYSSKEGQALKELYDAHAPLAARVKILGG